MRKRRPGTKLAVAIPEHWPRWLNIVLYFLAAAICIGPTIWFLLDRTYTTYGLLEVLIGILGAFSLVITLRLLVLSMLVGDTIVEISQEPAVIGKPLGYFVLQRRASAGVRSMEARYVQRRIVGVRDPHPETAVSLPLAAATVEPGGCRKIEGSMIVPDVPPMGSSFPRRSEWFILVRVTFPAGLVHEEEHPIVVEARWE